MLLVTRLILILSLLMQSVPGLTVISCTSMASGECVGGARSDLRAHAACACCCVEDDATLVGCPTGDKTMACRCGQAQPEKPASPPGDPKHEQLRLLLAFLPGVSDSLEPAPLPVAAKWCTSGPSPHRPSNSAQSLLCVWVM